MKRAMYIFILLRFRIPNFTVRVHKNQSRKQQMGNMVKLCALKMTHELFKKVWSRFETDEKLMSTTFSHKESSTAGESCTVKLVDHSAHAHNEYI